MNRGVLAALFSLTAALLPAAAEANLIANGNFSSTCASGQYCTFGAGDSTDIPGWNVTGGSVDLITGYWQAPPGGGNSVDLDGLFARGGLASTTFTSTAGAEYQLTFELSGNPDGGNPLKTVQVSIAGIIQNFTFDTSVVENTHSDMKWVKETLTFFATGALTTLTFQSLDDPGSAYGPVVGQVDVEPIPEPSSVALIGIGLLALVGFGSRRRRPR